MGTLCNHVTGSSLKLGPSYEIGGYSFDRHIVVLPGSSTAVVCHKECPDNMHPKGCLRTGSMGAYDICRDVHMKENSCSVGSAWMSTRASYREAVNLVFDVAYNGASQVLACSGNDNSRGCDTLVVDDSRTSCPVFCEPSLGTCITPAPSTTGITSVTFTTVSASTTEGTGGSTSLHGGSTTSMGLSTADGTSRTTATLSTSTTEGKGRSTSLRVGNSTMMGLSTTITHSMHGALSGCAGTKLGLLRGFVGVLFLASLADA